MQVQYAAPNHGGHRYQCTKESLKHGAVPYISVQGRDLDSAVERIVLVQLAAPPVDMLRQALAETHAAERVHLDRIEADRQRLQYEEEKARERFLRCDPRRTRVYAFAQEELDKAMQARAEFATRLATEPSPPPVDGTEQEIGTLCSIVSDIPALWRDPVVTHKERKEILSCLISQVFVDTTAERIDGTIHWRSGARTTFFVWRKEGMYRLIRERHADGLTVKEIREWLARGDPRTGQHWPLTRERIYAFSKKEGLRPNPPEPRMLQGKARARELYDEGHTVCKIVDRLNLEGFRTASGDPWTSSAIYHHLGRGARRTEMLARMHRQALADAKRRGLTNQETAGEFNASDREYTA